MPLIEWRKEFAIGIAEVDHEHHQLINLINSLYANLENSSSPEVIGEVLGDIHANISAHFALEEKVMHERHYDQYAQHKADHERLLDEIRDIMDAYDSGIFADYDRQMAGHLDQWFSRHFQTMDARLHKTIGGGHGD